MTWTKGSGTRQEFRPAWQFAESLRGFRYDSCFSLRHSPVTPVELRGLQVAELAKSFGRPGNSPKAYAAFATILA